MTEGREKTSEIFVINLARRPDRLADVGGRLRAFGLDFTRIDAVDAHDISPEVLDEHFADSGPLGQLSTGDKCCSLSHRRTWEALIESGCQYGIVLEDDAVFSPSFADVVRDLSWIPRGVELVKLERFGPRRDRVLLAKAIARAKSRSLHRLLSKHTGSAGYIISRSGAIAALALTQRMNISIDHILFNRNNSPIADRLVAFQLRPAVVEQADQHAAESDIVRWRVRGKPTGLGYWRRELWRAYYEIRYLPRQTFEVLFHGARLARLTLDDSTPAAGRNARTAADR